MSPDLVAALRGLRRNPAFSIASVTVLALASAATATVLVVTNALLFRPLPVVQQGRIAIAWKEDHKAGFAHYPFTYQSVVALRPQLTTISDFATIDYNGAWPLSTSTGDRGYRLPVGMVSGNLFPLLGVVPVIGRLISQADDVMGGPRVIVISESYWRTRYQSDPTVLGKSLPVLGIPHEIIGVSPADFAYPKGAVAWIPMFTWQGEWLNNPDAVTQDIVVRLKPGRTVDQFRAELEAARARTPAEQRAMFANHRVVVRGWSDEVTGDLRLPLFLLGAGALIVLIAASTNVGALVLVRLGDRAHELAVRLALGGPRSAVLRTALLEPALVIVAGIAAGLALTWLMLQVVEPMLPLDLGRARSLPFGALPAVAAVAIGLSVGLAGGLGPAVVLLRTHSLAALRFADRRTAAGWGNHPIRRALVVGQTLFAVMSASTAGLLIRSLDRLNQIEVGFDPENLLFADLTTTNPTTVSVAAGRNWIDRMIEAVSRVPGVTSVAANFSPPFVGNAGGYAKLRAEGQPEIAELPLANYEPVTPGYFVTMGARLVRGRLLLPSDNEMSQPVVVITQRLAQLLWPGQDPVGRRLAFADAPELRWRTVVGVIADTRYNNLRVAVPTFLLPYRQSELIPYYLLVRTRPGVTPGTIEHGIRRAISDTDPAATLVAATPMRSLLRKPVMPTTVIGTLATGFGVVTVILAAVGLYGVLSSMVLQRRREIGIRMALGARGIAVGTLIGREALMLLGCGVSGGLVVTLLISRWLKILLYETAPTDLLTFGAVTGVIVSVAGIATVFPVRRAVRTDPAVVLRADEW